MTSNQTIAKSGFRTMKNILCIVFFVLLNACVFAQKKEAPAKDPVLDAVDYDVLFDELDDFLDSLLKPRSYTIVSVNGGSNYFDYTIGNNLKTEKQLVISPSVGYFDKSGFGINANLMAVKQEKKLNAYQLATSLSYDYLKNMDFATGISATHYFTKEKVDFYTSPLKNEVFGYFSYRRLWVKPALSASYGWGSRTSFEDREQYITKLRLRKRGYTRVNVEETVADFNVMLSLRHDFYWLDILTPNSFIRLSPQLSFTGGTQKFGFNQTTNSYRYNLINGKVDKQQSEKVSLDDQMKFQPLSVACALRSEFSLGKFFLQPQLAFNYYLPAEEKNLAAMFSVNTGFIF